MSPRPRIYASPAERQRAYRARKALRNANRHAPEPIYADGAVTIYCGNWRDVLPCLDPASFDLVVTDPPYGTGGWRRVRGKKSLIVEPWDDGGTDWLRLVAPRPVLAFWPAAHAQRLLDLASAVGLVKHRCLYWQKPDPMPRPDGGTRLSVEPIWVLSPPGFVLYGGTDIYVAPKPRAAAHPYEKPLEVLLWLIQKTSARTILDPFLGSGTTALAAKLLGRRCIGIEIDPTYAARAADRCRQAVLPLTPTSVNRHAPLFDFVTLAAREADR